MRQLVATLVNQVRATKLVSAFAVVATIAMVSATGAAAAAPSYFNVPKPTSQKVCYSQYGGAGWKALGFKNLDHCLRYVSTPAPKDKAACNHGWWYVYGFNSRGQCVAWVAMHGGGGYEGDPNEWF